MLASPFGIDNLTKTAHTPPIPPDKKLFSDDPAATIFFSKEGVNKLGEKLDKINNKKCICFVQRWISYCSTAYKFQVRTILDFL